MRQYVVGRTFGWLPGSCRLLVRHGYDSFIYDGFLHPACALIAIGRL